MSGLLFVSQTMLDSWTEQGKIDFVGNVMTLLSGEGKGRSYALDPAVKFLKVEGDEPDPHQLVRKVKSDTQLREMGADHVDASVIYKDAAYQVEPGFLAEVSVLQAAATAQAQPRAAPPSPQASAAKAALPRDLEARRQEAEALAKFLLENLS
ncbi:MAG: hypothetical protein WCC48_00200 [Anaeromyxobacteraceae bacterium]